MQTQALLRILTGIMRLNHQQAEKSDHKRTWAGISNVCTDIKSLHSLADLVLGAEEPKTSAPRGVAAPKILPRDFLLSALVVLKKRVSSESL